MASGKPPEDAAKNPQSGQFRDFGGLAQSAAHEIAEHEAFATFEESCGPGKWPTEIITRQDQELFHSRYPGPGKRRGQGGGEETGEEYGSECPARSIRSSGADKRKIADAPGAELSTAGCTASVLVARPAPQLRAATGLGLPAPAAGALPGPGAPAAPHDLEPRHHRLRGRQLGAFPAVQQQWQHRLLQSQAGGKAGKPNHPGGQ